METQLAGEICVTLPHERRSSSSNSQFLRLYDKWLRSTPDAHGVPAQSEGSLESDWQIRRVHAERMGSCSELAINGEVTEWRLAMWREPSTPLVCGLEDWMRTDPPGTRVTPSWPRRSINIVKCCDGVSRFFDNGRIFLADCSAEWALRLYRLRRK